MVLPATADDDLCKSRPCPLLLFYQFPRSMKRTNRTDIWGTSRSLAGWKARHRQTHTFIAEKCHFWAYLNREPARGPQRTLHRKVSSSLTLLNGASAPIEDTFYFVSLHLGFTLRQIRQAELLHIPQEQGLCRQTDGMQQVYAGRARGDN